MEVYFYSYFIVLFFFSVWFDKNDYDHNDFFSFIFYILGAAPSFSLPAASVCVTMLCLFQTCIIIKKSLKVITPMVSVNFPAYVLPLLFLSKKIMPFLF